MAFNASIKMDINSIGNNIASSDDVYWIVTLGDNNIDCSDGINSDNVLAYGTFNGVSQGDTLDLLSNINIESLLTFLNDDNKYNTLISILDKYRFLEWNNLFSSVIKHLSLGEEEINIFNYSSCRTINGS